MDSLNQIQILRSIIAVIKNPNPYLHKTEEEEEGRGTKYSLFCLKTTKKFHQTRNVCVSARTQCQMSCSVCCKWFKHLIFMNSGLPGESPYIRNATMKQIKSIMFFFFGFICFDVTMNKFNDFSKRFHQHRWYICRPCMASLGNFSPTELILRQVGCWTLATTWLFIAFPCVRRCDW